MSEKYIRAMQLVRSIGYRCHAADGCIVIHDGADIHCVPLSLVDSWVRSH